MPWGLPRPVLLGLLLAGLLLAGLTATASVSRAETPVVRFDVSHAIGCRDVTPEEFTARNRSDRLIECRLRISSFIERGDPDELIEFLYTIESPRKAFAVVDYEPKTTLESPIAGNVGIERKKEKSVTLGLGLAGNFQHLVNADASGSALNKTLSSVRYDLIPSSELVAASGTIQRGHGVYFKLRPSKQTTLEGAKEFVIVMRVPRGWQADYLHLRCEATSSRRGGVYPLHETEPSGLEHFVVALYAEGDATARQAVETFAHRELQLRTTAVRHRQAIRRRSFPSLADKVGRLLDVASPKIPPNWYTEVLYGGAGPSEPEFLWRLPDEVADAARQYTAAKQALHALNAHASANANAAGQLAQQTGD